MKRRYKLLLIIVISFLLAIIIYKINYKPKVSYLFLGERYNNLSTYDFNDYINYSFKNKPYKFHEVTEPMILDEYLDLIKTNKDNINYYIKNASFIVISLGTLELENYKKIDTSIIIEYLNNLYKLLSYIRKLNNNDIFLINLYDNNYTFINNKIKKYTMDYNIYYIDKSIPGPESLFYIQDKLLLTYKGHEKVANYILSKVTSWYNKNMEEDIFENKELVNAEIKAIKKANVLESLGFTIDEVMDNVKGKDLIDITLDKIKNTLNASNMPYSDELKDLLLQSPNQLIENLSIIRDKISSPELISDYNRLIYIVKNLDKIKSLV